MTDHTSTSGKGQAGRLGSRLLAISMATLGLVLLLASTAMAVSKQPVDFFGGTGVRGGQFRSPVGIAVNESGAGPANSGDVYVTEPGSNRIQRFARDDNGTPSLGADDTYSFISAWGADVDPSSGANSYEVCTGAEDCREGAANGSGGALSSPAGIAVDQDTGDVYVADRLNNRISAYTGDGAFLRSFGFDVVVSGTGDTGTGYEVCVAANGDVCQAGVSGSGVGQIGDTAGFGNALGIAVSQADGNPATGTVFLADRANHRINAYGLDGSSPSAIGSATFDANSPLSVAIDSRGIVYASNSKNKDEVERYDSENANGGGIGFLAPIAAGVNEVQQVTIDATGGTFNLTYNGETTVDLPFDARAGGEAEQETPGVIDTVLEALIALPSIGGQNLKDGREVRVNGGPGNAGGTSPYTIEFATGLGATDVEQITASSGATPLSGGAGASVATLTAGQPGLEPDLDTSGLTVDPDSDAAGPDIDTLYVQRTVGSPHVIQQFGPLNAPGLTVPPSAFDDVHGTTFGAYNFPASLAIDQPSGRLYVPISGEVGSGVYVLDTPGPGPSASLDSLSDVTATSVTAHATITPNGTPALSYRLEYSTDGVKWESTPKVILGTQKTPQSVSPVLNPPGGLEPNTLYHVRLVAKRPFFPTIVSAEKTFTTLAAPPLVETIGSPLRTTSTVRLDGRVSPRNSATTYHFEYGEQGPCDANPCTPTAPQAIGSGSTFQLVSQQIEGLDPNTTYHYRVVADNGNAGSPATGADMTVTTRGDEAPLSHGRLPGPVGSDRAWEMVSAPDTGGNPVGGIGGDKAATISDAGDRAVYGVAGGTPDSETGLSGIQLFAERTASGWKTKKIHPSREVATGPIWSTPGGPSDLSSLITENIPQAARRGEYSLWRLSPNDPPAKLYATQDSRTGAIFTSDDGSRVLATYTGPQDPSHPVPANVFGLYDLSSGSPQLISLLPDGTLPPCGVSQASSSTAGLPNNGNRLRHIVSADGSLAFFPTRPCLSTAPERLYMRDIPAETTALISTPPVSGPECNANFIKSIPGAVFFYTQSRLVAEDAEPEKECVVSDSTSPTGGDVYRYEIGNGALECLTCLAPGLGSEVIGHGTAATTARIGVAEDGSRVYFTSRKRLLAGAPASEGIYRLDVASKSLAYVGSFGFIGNTDGLSYMNPDGSVVVFKSDKPSVNAVGGQQNGGTMQYYRYDDRDRSLICVSCPAGGSLPRGAATSDTSMASGTPGANRVPLSEDGEVFAFPTPASLVPADQNTAGPGQDPRVGMDIYEWRAGRLLLVSDGLTKWLAGEPPSFQGITPSGHDIFFTAAIQYTKDALDGYNRLYDARIGGGFEFPPPPKPCPLEVCQGVPKGAPEEAAPGTASIVGAGNVAKTGRVVCTKPKRKVRKNGKTRCVKPKPRKNASSKKASSKKASHERRTAR